MHNSLDCSFASSERREKEEKKKYDCETRAQGSEGSIHAEGGRLMFALFVLSKELSGCMYRNEQEGTMV